MVGLSEYQILINAIEDIAIMYNVHVNIPWVGFGVITLLIGTIIVPNILDRRTSK